MNTRVRFRQRKLTGPHPISSLFSGMGEGSVRRHHPEFGQDRPLKGKTGEHECSIETGSQYDSFLSP
jgi:hypothetical protein